MDRPSTTHPATAREVILEIVRNMREGLEPLHFSTLAPAVYHVYLHPSDMERLRAITPRIVDEARRALDEAMASLNRPSLGERLRISRRGEPRIAPPEGGWQIRILENTDDDVDPGDIVIHSELAMPAKPEYGGGAMTKRIATRRMGGAKSSALTYQKAPAGSAPASEPGAGALAIIEYEDNGGRKTYCMTKEEIVVGRGGRDYWTDLTLDALPDVSREHCRLRRDAATGQFFLKDLSRLGTTINGEKAPSSVDASGGERRDLNVETPLPAQARIGLAGVVFLDFRSVDSGRDPGPSQPQAAPV
jgi:hypothetical protein